MANAHNAKAEPKTLFATLAWRMIMPDADMEMATRIMADSAFGCAGQRCLAASVAIAVGEAQDEFVERIADAASSRKVGYGLDAAPRKRGEATNGSCN